MRTPLWPLLVPLMVMALAWGCGQPSAKATPTIPLPTATPQAAATPTATPAPTPWPTPPPFQTPRKEAAYQPEWSEEDLRGLDPWGDAGGDGQDLVAVYFRQEESLLKFRADFIDLRSGKLPDLYLALDLTSGGTTSLEPGGKESADLSWDILVKVSAGQTAQAMTPDLRPVPGAVAAVRGDPTLDYVTLDLNREALPVKPDGPFRFQALAVTPDRTDVVDRMEPVSSDASPQGRGRLVIHFGNLLGASTPHGVSSWYDSREADRDGQVKPKGWRYLLDAVERYWVPIALDVKQMQYLAWTSDLGLYERLRAGHDAGLLDMPDTLAYGHFMAWQPQDVDAKAIELARGFYRQLGLPSSPTFSPYEGRITVADLETIRQAGYEAVIVGAEPDYYGWFGGTMEEAIPAAGKLHRANGIGLLFQRFPWSLVWEPRWNNVDNPWAEGEADIWRGTDGGLQQLFRRNLLDLALDPDQEQFITLGTDIGVTPWGFAEVADANLRWIAEHPWIKVLRHDQLFQQGWKVIDHGDLNLPPDAHLPRFTLEEDMHYNTYFPQFYYGGISDGHSPSIPKGQKIESYADYVPYWRDGLPIPSGRKMGDDRTPGTIIYETLRNLRSAPDNGLTTLAWLSYFIAIGEQTFHATKALNPHDPEMERGDIPYGGAYLHPGAKMRANTLRQVNKLIAAARWAEAAARGAVSSQPTVEAADLDLDGEDEYVLRNDRLFLVFEDDGGRLEYAFGFIPGRGPVQFVAPVSQFTADIFLGPSQWDWSKGEAGQSLLVGVGAFVEQLHDGTTFAYHSYRVSVGEGQLTFVSPDGKVRKSFTLAKEGKGVIVQYETAEEVIVEVQVAPDPLRMWSGQWSQGMAEVIGKERMGLRYADGLAATLTLLDGARWYNTDVASFLESPARWERRHDPKRQDYPSGHWGPYPFAQLLAFGRGSFALRLSLEP